ncbi:hypothetical protein NLG97_g4308 [Lecanicillium saksenae]|uniref:Uncharacterized protein n=1 Tax=Lecanicillium saksenae TaxID=468837 RepID=A0ACC1QW84_9HYPO|nr:hypothetical protein NLG97_g4308 [Lecanicillium saksenae]
MAMLRLLKAKEEGKPARDILLIKTAIPWNTYEKIYDMTLGANEPFLVVERKSITCDLFLMRRFSALTNNQINMLEFIQHPNFATAHEIYKLEDSYLVVFEHLTVSLAEAVGNPFLNRPRLAAIIGQIVEALQFLETHDLSHNHLKPSTILLHPSGRVKLIGQENCTKYSSRKDIRDLGCVMMELIQGYAKDSENLGLDNPQNWDAEVVDFLSATTSASSVSQLQKHPFIQRWQKERLKGFISLVMKWAMPECKYLGSVANEET